MICLFCKNELSFEQWNKKLNYEENRQNDAYIMNNLNQMELNKTIKEKKINQLKYENIIK